MAKRGSLRRLAGRGALYTACLIYTGFVLSPILWLLLMSLSTNRDIVAKGFWIPAPPRWENWMDVLTQGRFITYFANSVAVVLPALVGIVLVGALGAYAFARFSFPAKETLYLGIFAFIVLPQQILLIPIFIMFTHYGLHNTRIGLILVYISISLPLTVYILRNFFEQIPEELADAARIDGCSEWEVFSRIMLPLARPAVASVIIFHFIFLWNEFLLANIFIREESLRTIQLGLMQYFGRYYLDYAHLAAASLLSALPILALYLSMSRQFIAGMTAGALHG
jgi:ABC-type glycerol-3-phosphate transport system permease component